MRHRLVALLLSAAMILVGVGLSPCVSGASCAMGSARRMNCCAAKSGITTPRCCYGTQQVRGATQTAPERSTRNALAASASFAACSDAAVASPTRVVLARRVDTSAAPPGGTLIAQHTSLLL